VLGIMPTLLIVPASLEGAGRRILKAQNKADGASNEWVESAELLVTPWLG
jgi:phage major head subunit gpT-like protein